MGVSWPSEWVEWRRGAGCPMCEGGRPEENEHGVRILAGRFSDAYLQRVAWQRGYTVVVWRGRHVAEPTELSKEEATQYWLEVLEAGRRLERAFDPVKVNYETLGNALPHLHTHVMPRYADDPKPGWPSPHPEGKRGTFDEQLLRRDAEELRR